MPEDTSLPFGMTDDQLIRLSWILAAFFFALAILGAVGEILGWWNDTGEVLVTVGSLAGLFVTAATAYYAAGRDQVAVVKGTVEDNNSLVEENNEILSESNEKLDQLEELDKLEQMDRQVELLQGIRDRL